jgi:peptidoglycan-associated lipoprotein
MLIGVADGNGVAGLSNDYGIVSHGTRFALPLASHITPNLGFRLQTYFQQEERKMKTIHWVVLFIAVMMVATGCSKTVMENQATTENPPEIAQAEPAEPEPAPQVQDDGRMKFIDQAVLFDFDSAVLRPGAQTLLQEKAAWLKANSSVPLVLIEGHCDERGTEAYNMALGAKRAESVKNFLLDLGVDNKILDTQSFGEEKPAVQGHDEAAWSQNRRASFVINE